MTKTIPEPNEELKKLLEAIRKDPGAVESDVCALPDCQEPFEPPWEVMFYRPDVPYHPTRYLVACSMEHHQEVIDYFGLVPFMDFNTWRGK